MTNYNLNELFTELQEETAFQSDLLFLKKGQRYFTALLEPAEYQNEMKLGLKVESEYKGKPTHQMLMRVLHIPLKANNDLDFGKAAACGVVLPMGVAATIAKLFTDSANNPAEDPKQLCVNPCNLLMFTKEPKTAVTITSKVVSIPDGIWQEANEISWEQLMESYTKSQTSGKEKETQEESNPWD